MKTKIKASLATFGTLLVVILFIVAIYFKQEVILLLFIVSILIVLMWKVWLGYFEGNVEVVSDPIRKISEVENEVGILKEFPDTQEK